MYEYLVRTPLANATKFGVYYNILPNNAQYTNVLHAQSQQWKRFEKVWNKFRFNNKDTRTTPWTSFWCPYCNFEHFIRFILVFLLLTLKMLMFAAWCINKGKRRSRCEANRKPFCLKYSLPTEPLKYLSDLCDIVVLLCGFDETTVKSIKVRKLYFISISIHVDAIIWQNFTFSTVKQLWLISTKFFLNVQKQSFRGVL